MEYKDEDKTYLDLQVVASLNVAIAVPISSRIWN